MAHQRCRAALVTTTCRSANPSSSLRIQGICRTTLLQMERVAMHDACGLARATEHATYIHTCIHTCAHNAYMHAACGVARAAELERRRRCGVLLTESSVVTPRLHQSAEGIRATRLCIHERSCENVRLQNFFNVVHLCVLHMDPRPMSEAIWITLSDGMVSTLCSKRAAD